MDTTTRNAGLDALRVVGLVAVVVGHTLTDGLTRSLLYPWHVPLFFFLSGYLDRHVPTTAQGAGSPRPLSAEWRTRLRTLLVPYATWLVLFAAAFVPVTAATGGSPVRAAAAVLAGGDHLGKPFSAFWFVTALAAACLLVRLLDRGPAWLPWSVAVAGLGAVAIAPGAVAAVPWSLGVAVPSLVFLLAGRLLRRAAPRLTRPMLWAAGLGTMGVAAVALGSRPLDLKQGDFGVPLAGVLVALCLCTALTLAFQTIGSRLPSWAAQTATSLALVGIGVVLTHSAVIWAAESFVDSVWLVTVLALVVPWAAALALQRTRLAPLALGVSRRR
ncbi:acyltransferase family protein [Frondihabitans australicus]|uniref:acyltransferase family protein n=1 Tax=Frondihabitans australicus TaxID=386892 RepID=UPI002482E8D7|nr:acyltransferase [Frondihabitans australicus]